MPIEKFTLDPEDQVTKISISCYRPIEDVESFCLTFCQHYAFITHDQDVNDDGTPKETHVHLLATFHKKMRVSAIVRRFLSFGDTSTNTTVLYKKMLNKATAYDYLTHSNAPKKYQYNEQDITTDDATFWRKTDEQLKEEENEEFFNDLMSEKPRTMAIRYGRDYIKNYRRYDEFKLVMEAEDARERRRLRIEEICQALGVENETTKDSERESLERYIAYKVTEYCNASDEVTDVGLKTTQRQAIITFNRIKETNTSLEYLVPESVY